MKLTFSGILPQVLLAILLVLAPLIMRLLVSMQGPTDDASHELSVAKYYFSFLFFELFLVISISSGLTTIIRDFVGNFGNSLTDVPGLLARNLPKSSDYFLSYMVLQAFTVSAGALVQIWPLICWFLFGAFDSTARQKFERQIGLNSVQWGTFFPVYANLAAIGELFLSNLEAQMAKLVVRAHLLRHRSAHPLFQHSHLQPLLVRVPL